MNLVAHAVNDSTWKAPYKRRLVVAIGKNTVLIFSMLG